MHGAFKKLKEISGAALWQFDFAIQLNPFVPPINHYLQVATKDGRAQPHINADDGLNYTGSETTEEQFEVNFEKFISRLKGG